MNFSAQLSRRIIVVSLALVGLLVLATASSHADDRDLLRQQSGNPNVMFIFDTSGSMNWSPQCSQEDFDNGICDYLCPTGDCFVPLSSDDPNSKFYQAKDALYEVIDSINDINFGFASFNQDSLYVRGKHWLYEAQVDGPSIPGWGPVPVGGTNESFGRSFTCPTGGSDANQRGCRTSRPLRGTVTWERERARRLPKGGSSFSSTTDFFVQGSDGVHRVRYQPVNGASPADPDIDVRVRIWRCLDLSSDPNCSFLRFQIADEEVEFELQDEFLAWENGATTNQRQKGYFSQSSSADASGSNTCAGWDPNDDTASDISNGLLLRQPTVTSPLSPLLDLGDVVPLNWTSDNKDTILQRLAPNIALGETTPDFSNARYFQDLPVSGRHSLRNGTARPLVADGSTPLGNILSDFRSWYGGTSAGGDGWKDLAIANDPDWGCRKTYIIMLTDGDDTCGGSDACSEATTLFQTHGVPVYVVAFGVQGGGNKLVCMANNGGTGAPFYPQNKDQLVDVLTTIFGGLQEEARSFASAAVPTVQSTVEDKIFLSSFLPLNDESVWAGELDAYIKPLPLTADFAPDEDRACVGDSIGCHAWDAGESLLAQIPSDADLGGAIPDFKIGLGTNERRLFYPEQSAVRKVPQDRRLFTLPAPPPDPTDFSTFSPALQDIVSGFELVDQSGVLENGALGTLLDTMKFVVARKEATIEDPDTGLTETIDYILGDIFHSNPLIIGNPDNFLYYVNDVSDYRSFADINRIRRKVALVGSNDGQVHAFDAGTYSSTVGFDTELQCNVIQEQRFTNGTGHELFSYMPRMVLPTVKEQAASIRQIYSVDGAMVSGDVFIDPENEASSPPAEADREWRTVVVGGLREGGKGYFALDITTPDQLLQQSLCNTLGDLKDRSYAANTLGNSFVPFCTGFGGSLDTTSCGPLPYPSVLWEFEDVRDEDLNGFSDLAYTWSPPTMGRIRVCPTGGSCDPSIANNDVEDRFIALFGGGFDPMAPAGGVGGGNFIYMVDVETGEILYKREVDGAVPSELGAVDTDFDTFLDTVYFGTTAGTLYKTIISSIGELQTSSVVIDTAGNTELVTRVADAAWEPFEIFDTGGLPIFFPPAVIFVPEAGSYAIAFGVGNREDLWVGQTGAIRFHTILDENFQDGDANLPKVATDYAGINVDDAANGGNFLTDPLTGNSPGWVLNLDPAERLITKPFALSGVLFFTVYQPDTVVIGTSNGNTCARTGESRIFILNTVNGDPFLREQDPDNPTGPTVSTRFQSVGDFVTDPFAELNQTRNQASGNTGSGSGSGSGSGGTGGGTPDPEDNVCDNETLQALRQSLTTLFPQTCRFANQTINVQTVRSDLGLVCIAPVPVCVVEKNWGEF